MHRLMKIHYKKGRAQNHDQVWRSHQTTQSELQQMFIAQLKYPIAEDFPIIANVFRTTFELERSILSIATVHSIRQFYYEQEKIYLLLSPKPFMIANNLKYIDMTDFKTSNPRVKKLGAICSKHTRMANYS